jgi:hypothetical protein
MQSTAPGGATRAHNVSEALAFKEAVPNDVASVGRRVEPSRSPGDTAGDSLQLQMSERV